MIVIKMLGIDQFQGQDIVNDIHSQVAQIFETDPEDIIFYTPDSFLVYKGVEQTSYHLDLEIELPEKYKPLENQIATYLSKLLVNQITVHLRVLFTYFDEDNEHIFINEDYPKYMTNENMAHFEVEDENTEPYLGDAFADYEKRVHEKELEQISQERERLAKKDFNK